MGVVGTFVRDRNQRTHQDFYCFGEVLGLAGASPHQHQRNCRDVQSLGAVLVPPPTTTIKADVGISFVFELRWGWRVPLPTTTRITEKIKNPHLECNNQSMFCLVIRAIIIAYTTLAVFFCIRFGSRVPCWEVAREVVLCNSSIRILFDNTW